MLIILSTNRIDYELGCADNLSEIRYFVKAGELLMRFKAKQWDYLRDCWHLTPREIEVAKLVCEGHNNEQIANKLHIAYNTVRVHLGHICSKVGVRGKIGLIIQFTDTLQRAKI